MGKRVLASVLMCAFWLSGCTAAVKNPPETAKLEDGTQAEVEHLRKQVRTLEEQLRQSDLQATQCLKQSANDASQIEYLLAERKQLRAFPGHEAAFRVVYAGLQEGNSTLLASLLPKTGRVEAGMSLTKNRTYKLYDRASDIDLQPFVDYAKQHPLSSAQITIYAQMPGEPAVAAGFADGTFFVLAFDGGKVTKIAISDKPPLSGA